ncbi:phage terminase large subunit [Ancylobacter sp.]|uniref:phage terminase large subunit n=1 Tax=Ancylobacter sp. TaxID=1872567 RepID=UPI003BAD2198
MLHTALSLPPLSEIEKEIDRRECRDLATFAQRAWHVLEPASELKWGWALDAMCEHLEAVSYGEITRLLMNVPPGCMKSLLTGVLFPAWEWGPRGLPHLRFLGTSHKQELAVRDNLKCRRLIQSEWFQERWPITLTGDQNAKTKFENDATGFREAMAFTSMTGARGDRVLLDDPLSVDAARSPTELENAGETFTTSLPTRLNNDESAIIVIMQRLHENDTSGIIIERELGYVHLCLPMEYDPARHCTTSIGFSDPRTVEGELLFPERFNRKKVEELKKVLRTAASGQLQQNPRTKEGDIFQEDWWQMWPPGGEQFDDEKRPLKRLEFPELNYVLASVDTAMTEKQENDASAMTVWGVWSDERGNPKIMLLAAWEDRLQFRPLVEKIIATCRRWRVDRLLVEAKANGISVAQEIIRLCMGEEFGTTLIQVNASESKEARAYSVQHLFENGLIYAPDRKYAQKVIEQCAVFPKGKHDDLVDSTTHALRALRDMGLAKLVEEHDEDMRREFGPKGPHRPIYDV